MDMQKERNAFEEWYENHKPVLLVENIVKGTARAAWQAAKAQAVPEGFALVSQKELLELTIAINAVDLATHTESKTNEVREMWQQVALKLMVLGTAQEPK